MGWKHALIQTVHEKAGGAPRVIDRSVPGGELRTTAQARTKSRVFGRRGTLEESAITSLWCLRRADGTAVDASRCHPHVEHTVEPWVARDERVVQRGRIVDHTSNY